MKLSIPDRIHRINYLSSEIDSIYHQATLKIGLTDSSSRVLYTICDNGGECQLSDIYKLTGIRKQTVNSAIRGLEKDEVIYLKNNDGRSKKVILTDKGKALSKETVFRLFELENRIFSAWSEHELDLYIELTEKFIDLFRKEMNSI